MLPPNNDTKPRLAEWEETEKKDSKNRKQKKWDVKEVEI